MRATLICYEHTRIGFPRVKLKWMVEEGKWGKPYIVIKNIIQKDTWSWQHPHPDVYPQDEMARFDKWVGERYSDDASVQG